MTFNFGLPAKTDLSSEERAKARSEFGIRVLVVTAVGAIISLFVLNIFLLVKVLDIAEDNNNEAIAAKTAAEEAQHAAESSQTLLDVVQDCLDPEGKCGKASIQADKEQLGDLSEIVYLSNSCSDKAGEQSFKQIQACVIDKLTSRDVD